MPYINDVTATFPKYYYSQKEIAETLQRILNQDKKNKYINQIFNNSKVEGRHTALPLEEYGNIKSFKVKNDHWIKEALDLSTQSIHSLLEKTQIDLNDIKFLVSNTITGVSVPSLDAKIMNKIPFSQDIKRVPLFGYGCLAGAAGINLVNDLLKGNPKAAAILFSVELCTLTFQLDDHSMESIVSAGLFGDGSAAVLMVGDEHPLAKKSPFKIVDTLSSFFPNSESAMGWDMVDTGFKIVLGKNVPELSAAKLPHQIDKILERNSLERQHINYYLAHPGGPKVMWAIEETLGLKNNEFKTAWDGLKKYGNLSSVSVLLTLKKQLESLPPINSHGLMFAMGPAFCSEIGLLQCLKD